MVCCKCMLPSEESNTEVGIHACKAAWFLRARRNCPFRPSRSSFSVANCTVWSSYETSINWHRVVLIHFGESTSLTLCIFRSKPCCLKVQTSVPINLKIKLFVHFCMVPFSFAIWQLLLRAPLDFACNHIIIIRSTAKVEFAIEFFCRSVEGTTNRMGAKRRGMRWQGVTSRVWANLEGEYDEFWSADQAKGLALAVSSSIFIGSSFIIKKKGLRQAGSTGLRAGSLQFNLICTGLFVSMKSKPKVPHEKEGKQLQRVGDIN